MNYTLTQELTLDISDTDKHYYVKFFNSWLQYIKGLFSDYKTCEIDIDIYSADGLSANYLSIEDFEKNYYDLSRISSCSFSIFLSKISHLTSDSPSICVNLYSDGKCTFLVKTESQVMTKDVMTSIERNISKLLCTDESINPSVNTSTPEIQTPFSQEPIPVIITSSNEEKKFVTASYNESKKFTLKVTILSCVLTAILSIIATLFIQRLA